MPSAGKIGRGLSIACRRAGLALRRVLRKSVASSAEARSMPRSTVPAVRPAAVRSTSL
jgi:hypothetical protein